MRPRFSIDLVIASRVLTKVADFILGDFDHQAKLLFQFFDYNRTDSIEADELAQIVVLTFYKPNSLSICRVNLRS